jgi:hypothetical protein
MSALKGPQTIRRAIIGQLAVLQFSNLEKFIKIIIFKMKN